MNPFTLVLFLSTVATVFAINRPVYKIVLTQKGFAQFLQYDVETPPLREFTFCTWIRAYDLTHPQSIFTYVANGNNRVVRLWLDSGGQDMKISVNGKSTSTSRVNVVKDVWRHVCLSYQSDFGAWALYVDSRLVSCEASQRLYGHVLPGGGSVIVGYGTALNGNPNGLEGEIFGANMILQSTIERNYTLKQNPEYVQKQFKRNQLKKDTKDNSYVVLSDLLSNDFQNHYDKNVNELLNSTDTNYIQVKTPHKILGDHKDDESQREEHEIFDFNIADFRPTVKDKFNTWEAHQFKKTQAEQNKAKLENHRITAELMKADTKNVPAVSEYETPPPLLPESFYFDNKYTHITTPLLQDMASFSNRFTTKQFTKPTVPDLQEYETPPPPWQSNKVYGQWTSSKFAGTVLNYLKNIRFKSKKDQTRKVPPTLPLYKISEVYPYPSNFIYTKIRPPSQFKRRNLVERYYDLIKRNPQINVQVFEDETSLRNKILKTHSETRPRRVDARSRGEPLNTHNEHRFYRSADYVSPEIHSFNDVDNYNNTLPTTKISNHRYPVPFHKSVPREELVNTETRVKTHLYGESSENLPEESQTKDSQITDAKKDMYYKSLAAKNKWHNVKTYSNDFTPHKLNIMYSKETDNLQKKYYPSLRLNYVHENRKPSNRPDPSIIQARKLAKEVSHQSNKNSDNSVSILKYNHGYLENHEKIKLDNMFSQPPSSKRNMRDNTNFDKTVKIGNALNEHDVVGVKEEEKKQSFEGGNDDVPDINKYRSDIDHTGTIVPPSLGPRVCKNVELTDRVLYVQKDESIDMTHIVSPMRMKNFAIEFVMQNYKKCSLTDSPFQHNDLLLIDWSKTPVRLFGGAIPKTTTDLCGFF